MLEKIKTNKEIDRSKADLLDEYAGPFCGEVFLTSRNMFDRFNMLNHMSINLRHDTGDGYMFSAVPDPDNPYIDINIDSSARLDSRMLLRLKERFKLDDEVVKLFEDQPGAARPLILAHEIAHIIQIDPFFSSHYGVEYSHDNPTPQEDYEGYLMSDSETNADFIAANIIANTEYGQMLGMGVPSFDTSRWRDWAVERPMHETIKQFGMSQQT